MRLLLFATLALGSSAFAQRNLNPVGNNGNILHPGVPLTSERPVLTRVNGGPSVGARSFGGNRSFGGGGAVLVPYPLYGSGMGSGMGFDGFYSGGFPSVHNPAPGTYDPIFGGYNPGPAYGAPFQAQPMGPPPTPTVIINQNFQTESIHPVFRDYSNAPLPEPGTVAVPPAAAPPTAVQPTAAAIPPAPPVADDQPTLYLIAMRDHTIFPAIAYWVQGDTLNYVTLQGAQNHVSLALVDRDFSKQLNDERNVSFRLPAAQ